MGEASSLLPKTIRGQRRRRSHFAPRSKCGAASACSDCSSCWAVSRYAGIGVQCDRPRCRRPAALVMPALALVILIFIVAYLCLPDQAGYLIPIIPAALLIASRFATRF